MAKVSGPLFSVDARGTLGGSISFKKNGDCIRVEKKPVPQNKRSALQAVQRVKFKGCSTSWRQVWPFQRDFCKAEGDRLGMTGFDWWMRECLIGRAVVLKPVDDYAYVATVDATAHVDYGLAYPVTYVFSVTSPVSGMIAWHKHRESDEWEEVSIKARGAFDSGEEVVRVDLASGKAYFSLSFDAGSDKVYMGLTESNGSGVEITFERVARYYDDKQAVVVCTSDDWTGDWEASHIAACEMFRPKKVWITEGLDTIAWGGHPLLNWANVQYQLDSGFVEAASHSRTHPWCPYSDYDGEIGGSAQDIRNNLVLPWPYRVGSLQYVPCWLEPYGDSNATVRAHLGQYKYLCDRRYPETPGTSFDVWDAANGVYGRSTMRVEPSDAGEHNVATLNGYFDACYALGQIYHLMIHPFLISDWDEPGYMAQHLNHLKDKDDVWYVGFGALYMYHYCEERGKVTVAKMAA